MGKLCIYFFFFFLRLSMVVRQLPLQSLLRENPLCCPYPCTRQLRKKQLRETNQSGWIHAMSRLTFKGKYLVHVVLACVRKCKAQFQISKSFFVT